MVHIVIKLFVETRMLQGIYSKYSKENKRIETEADSKDTVESMLLWTDIHKHMGK
jgi:hypothetical protein